MKKLLTILLASVLSFVMLTFIACAPASSDTTYEGNYQEVNSQTLYTATRNLSQNFNNEPTVGQKSGSDINFYAEFNTQTDTYFASEKISILGKMVAYTEQTENGNRQKVLISLTFNESNETKTDGYKSSISSTHKMYTNGEDFYICFIQNANTNGESSKTELKYKVSQVEFMQKFVEIVGKVSKDENEDVPTEENEFISFIDNLKTSAGYRFSISDEEELKIKIDLADKELFELYTKSQDESLEGFDISINKMEMFYVFNTEGKLLATKVETNIQQSSPYGNLQLINRADIRSYTGAISFPSDLNSYIDTTLVNP